MTKPTTLKDVKNMFLYRAAITVSIASVVDIEFIVMLRLTPARKNRKKLCVSLFSGLLIKKKQLT